MAKYPRNCRYVAYLTDYYGRVGKGKILGRSRDMELLAERVYPKVPEDLGWDWHIVDLETGKMYRPRKEYCFRGGTKWVFDEVRRYIPGYNIQWGKTT